MSSKERPKLSPMVQGLNPMLPEIGKVKIGKKGNMITSGQGKQFQLPQKLDHFVVTTLERGEDGNFLKNMIVHQALGDKPTEIPIRLLYNDPALNFQSKYACFVGTSRWCHGDGVNAYRKQKDGGEQLVPCLCGREQPTWDEDKHKCKITGLLSVVLPDDLQIGGVYKYRTTGFNSVRDIMSSLYLIHTITNGVLAGIPLTLCVRPKSAVIPATTKPTTVYTVSIVYKGSEADLRQQGYQLALETQEYRAKLEYIEDTARASLTPDMITEGESESDIAEEFYPEEVADDDDPDKPSFLGVPEKDEEVDATFDDETPNNGIAGDAISETDRDMGKAHDDEPAGEPPPATGSAPTEGIMKGWDMPDWVLDHADLNRFLKACAGHFEKSVLQIKKDAEEDPDNFCNAFRSWLGKQNIDTGEDQAKSKAPGTKKAEWDPCSADMLNRYDAHKKNLIMKELESRGIEFNPSHAGAKLHFLLRADIRDPHQGAPAAQPEPQAQPDEQSPPPSDDPPPGANEPVKDEFEMLVESEEWAEMSKLKTAHFQIYADITKGRTPRTMEKVKHVISEIGRLVAATPGPVDEPSGMPGA